MPFPANRQQTIQRETHAWALRCRGWAQTRIAAAIGLSQPGVSKMLKRIELRELKQLSGSVERIKARQNGQLEHVIEQSLDAWHQSKEPRKRAARRTGGDGQGGEVTTMETVERDGDPAHLYAAMQAMHSQRQLWGLDVAPALQEPAASVAELAKDLLIRATGYETRKETERSAAGIDGTDSAGAPPVPNGPEPIQ